MSSAPLFSVIIPTYHRNDLLAKCLDCLAPGVQTLTADQYEVIVTDDGSETTAEEMIQARYPWAKWVVGPRKGPAANRNNGAKDARGKWLVFTDDDCLPDAQWLDSYAKAALSEPSYSVLEGRVYADRPRRSLAEVSPINEAGGYLWSCNFAIEKKLFQFLTGFDERFPFATMEDVELRLRLTKAGYQYFFVKDASLCHPWRYINTWQMFQLHKKSILIYLSIHPEESVKFNSICYLKASIRGLLGEVSVGLFKLGGRGIKETLLKRVLWLQMAIIMAKKSSCKK